jgi:DNA-binding response OmpR family regulator
MAVALVQTKKSVLIIDDEPSLLQILAARLRYAGYEVYTAHNGAEGLKKAQAVSPNLILLDIMMPDMDGFAVLLRLKKNRRTRSAPVVMLTSRSETETIDRAVNMGAEDYIVKPFTPAVLMDKINRLLGKR